MKVKNEINMPRLLFDIGYLKHQITVLSFLLSAGLVILLCCLFEPIWASNDDVGLSMIAHGYGIAAYSTPTLIFCNVLWGYIVRCIPTLNGVLGYSLATMTLLCLSAWLMLFALLRLGAGYLVGILMIVLLFSRPILFPQFTINAGLATVAAFLGIQAWARYGGLMTLISALVLAFVGFIIRSQQFLLVLLVVLPLLPQAIYQKKALQLGLSLLCIAIAAAYLIDKKAYSDETWQSFQAFNQVRFPFTDFGATRPLQNHRSEIAAQQGFSHNDLDLLQGWFFADSKITDPTTLNKMLTELGPLPLQTGGIQRGYMALRTFFSRSLLPLLIAGLLLGQIVRQRLIMVSWLLCLAALLAIGIAGRPGVERIYIPLLSLLVIAPSAYWQNKNNFKNRHWIIVILIATTALNWSRLVKEQHQSKVLVQQIKTDLKEFPKFEGPLFSWGGDGIPYEWAFPVLAADTQVHQMAFYSLGCFTQAPFSVANEQERAGKGLVARLRSNEGIPIMASQDNLKMLDTYCQERFNNKLYTTVEYDSSTIIIRRAKCR